MKAILFSCLCLILGGCTVEADYGAGYAAPGYYYSGPGYYGYPGYYPPGSAVWLNNGGYPYWARNYPRGYRNSPHYHDSHGGSSHGGHHR